MVRQKKKYFSVFTYNIFFGNLSGQIFGFLSKTTQNIEISSRIKLKIVYFLDTSDFNQKQHVKPREKMFLKNI